MRELADCILHVDGRPFATSSPTTGDLTRHDPRRHLKGQWVISLGIAARDAAALQAHLGAEALLRTQAGRELGRLTVLKVDPTLGVLVAEVKRAAV